MSVPIILVTGFLGAGKTSFINKLLDSQHGRRIGAIVNDFGAINIDMEILEGSADSIVGIRNGCICCSLQGDLLRTLKNVLGHPSEPETVVIEASGAADPAGVVEALLDPVICRSAFLDSVICVVDTKDMSEQIALLDDALWRAQLTAADFVFLAKTDMLDATEAVAARNKIENSGRHATFDLAKDALPLDLLFSKYRIPDPSRYKAYHSHIADTRFTSVEWQHDGMISMPSFQRAIEVLSPVLIRAKGFLQFHENPEQTVLFQFVARRASLVPAESNSKPGCRLVLIGEAEKFNPQEARVIMEQVIHG